MIMPEGEIIQLYKEAKDKKKEITILADLNQCSVKEVRELLTGAGIEVPEDKRFTKKTPLNPLPAQKTADVPDSIRKILNERQVYLLKQIRQMQSEVDDINAFIGPYKGGE